MFRPLQPTSLQGPNPAVPPLREASFFFLSLSLYLDSFKTHDGSLQQSRQKKKCSGACRPCARNRRGACFRAIEASHKPFERPLAQRVIASGRTRVCQPSEGKRKRRAVSAHLFCLAHVDQLWLASQRKSTRLRHKTAEQNRHGGRNWSGRCLGSGFLSEARPEVFGQLVRSLQCEAARARFGDSKPRVVVVLPLKTLCVCWCARGRNDDIPPLPPSPLLPLTSSPSSPLSFPPSSFPSFSPSLLSPSLLTSSSLLSLPFFHPFSSFLAPCSPFLSLLPSPFSPLPHLSPLLPAPFPLPLYATPFDSFMHHRQNILVPQNVISSLTPRMVGP